MNAQDFRRIIQAFASRPADYDLEKGKLLAEIHDEMIEATVLQRRGDLIVEEAGVTSLATDWLINRVARLPLLAERILTSIPQQPSFIRPSGNILDRLDKDPNECIKQVEDACLGCRELLNQRLVGTSSVMYLTSDAGEGKTTLINELARSQAAAYKAKKTDWLLIPISLGGRPILRFDEVIVASLVNRYRFQFWYYEAFLELVRLGVVVPALDGFEEVWIQSGSGEAVSALGTLLGNLESSGTLLVAARKAFFDYADLATQGQLYDTIRTVDVTFCRVDLNRWSRNQFLEYMRSQKVSNPEGVYDAVSERLGAEHPLLTRAVLVSKLVQIAARMPDLQSLLGALGHAPHDYFDQFVRSIMEREAKEKWIDSSGEPRRPLLTVDEHYDLLTEVAHEMWLNSTEVLSESMLNLIADMAVEHMHKPPHVARQIKERLRQHALLIHDTSSRMYSFDHDQFRSFFAGRALALAIFQRSFASAYSLMNKQILTIQAADSAVYFLRLLKANIDQIAGAFEELCEHESPASILRENCGALLIRLLDESDGAGRAVRHLTFPPESLLGRKIKGLKFIDCHFEATQCAGDTIIESCQFLNCVFERLAFADGWSARSCVLENTVVRSVEEIRHTTQWYDPPRIQNALQKHGFTLLGKPIDKKPVPVSPQDDDLVLTERALRAFFRSTQVVDDVFKIRLGHQATDFFKNVLPVLLRANVLTSVPYVGSGRHGCYRLNVRMATVQSALQRCGGDFACFITMVSDVDNDGA